MIFCMGALLFHWKSESSVIAWRRASWRTKSSLIICQFRISINFSSRCFCYRDQTDLNVLQCQKLIAWTIEQHMALHRHLIFKFHSTLHESHNERGPDFTYQCQARWVRSKGPYGVEFSISKKFSEGGFQVVANVN